MISRLPFIASLISALVLSACGGSVINGTIHRAGVVDHFAASGGRDLMTVIVGNPFAQPKTVVDETVVAAMQGHHMGARSRFTTTPDASAIPIYRIAIVFDPARTTDSAAVCRNAPRIGATKTDGLRLLAAFCADDLPLTSVEAMIPTRADRADDPAVLRLIADVVRELIPSEDPLAYID